MCKLKFPRIASQIAHQNLRPRTAETSVNVYVAFMVRLTSSHCKVWCVSMMFFHTWLHEMSAVWMHNSAVHSTRATWLTWRKGGKII